MINAIKYSISLMYFGAFNIGRKNIGISCFRPSPSLKHKQVNADDASNEQRSDEFSSGSLAGSIASGSSGFGSLPKKRPALLASGEKLK